MKTFFSRRSLLHETAQKNALFLETEPNNINHVIADIEKTKCALDLAYAGFDSVTDPDLIDCYIYQVNATLKRYKYLLNLAAQLESEQKTTQETQTNEQLLHEKAPVRALV